MVQIVRYSETPVGPYDELVIMPGDFDVPVLSGSGGEGVKKKVKKNTRITGIWVSQKDTCWNGGFFFIKSFLFASISIHLRPAHLPPLLPRRLGEREREKKRIKAKG